MKKLHSFLGMRSFLILWGSQAVSSLGSAMTSYALILWVYGEKGTATSVSLLSLFSYLPSILFCFVAGTLADKWNKKKIMLMADLTAALGTATVFTLYSTGHLEVWHLYVVNFLISLMNAFQNPAAYVAVSLIAPKDQYTRVGGLYAFSGSLVTILTPAFATAIMAFGGIKTVFIVDIATFMVGFFTLLLFIRIPDVEAGLHAAKEAKDTFLQSCLTGIRFLKQHRSILRIILFFSFINLLAYMTGYGIFPAMILKRTGDNETILGMVSSARGIGALVGSLIVTWISPAKNKARAAYLACGIAFAIENLPLAIGRTAWIWMSAAFLGEFCMPFLNANLTTFMRTQVPLELQGRVFSTRDTLQYSTIPLGLFLGGILADHVFEPFMMGSSEAAKWFSPLVGMAPGSGMALMVLITGVIGAFTSFIFAARKSDEI